jgi:hypothetical protein
MDSKKKTVAIIGSGPAALMLAAVLDENRFAVSVYEKNAAAGRKFLVAGDGGFNLTHSEPVQLLLQRYSPPGFLDQALHEFSNEDLRQFLAQIRIPTFAGSSGRVFPEKGIKPIDVLNAFLRLLEKKNVQFFFRHEWEGMENGELLLQNGKSRVRVNADFIVFALGGASWPVTGSDGKWDRFFEERGIRVLPFRASNCRMLVHWPQEIRDKLAGKPLKNIATRCGSAVKKGELVITADGIEGGAVYFHSPAIREQLDAKGVAEMRIDFRPELSEEMLKQKISAKAKTRNAQLKNAGLSETAVQLLRAFVPKDAFLDDAAMARQIKSFAVKIDGAGPIEDAISSAGGIAPEECGTDFSLHKLPRCYAIGEMVAWDAPTGGYLLQACFSMGHRLGAALNEK